MRIMIIGGEDLSSTLAKFLCRDNEIICIAEDRVLLAAVEKLPNMTMFEGNGASSIVLEKAGIKNCDALISLMPKDEANIIACSKAKEVGVKKTAALVTDEDNIHTCNLLGIGYSITPEKVEVQKAIDIIESPGINDIHYFADHKLKLVGYTIKPGTISQTLSEHSRTLPNGCKIHGVVRNYTEFIPPAQVGTLEAGDQIYVLGTTEVMDGYSVFRRRELMNHDIVIAGSRDNRTSLELAEYFSSSNQKDMKVSVILNDLDLFNRVKDAYPGVTIVFGNITSQNLIKKAHIEQADVFVSSTGSDELNIFASTLAKKLGAKKTLALVSKLDYPLITRDLEIDRIVTPTFTTVAEILKYLFREELYSYSILQSGLWEVMEIKVNPLSYACGRKLAAIKMPLEVEVASIYRDGTITSPSHEGVYLPGDRVVIFSPAYSTSQVYKLFAESKT